MRKLAVICTLIFAALQGKAQQNAPFIYAIRNPFSMNPAMAGASGTTQATLVRKQQWKDFAGGVGGNYLNMEGKVGESPMGLGMGMAAESKGITNAIAAHLSWSYAVSLAEKSFLVFGLRAGILEQNIDLAKAIVMTANDPALTGEEQKVSAMDAGAGLSLLHDDKWEAGFAIPQVLGNHIRYAGTESTTSYTLNRHYIIHLKYRHFLDKDKKNSVSPMVITRMVPGAPLQWEGSLTADFAKLGWLGLSYRNQYALGILAGFRVGPSFQLGYGYEIITGRVGSYAGMSHEIVLGYALGTNKKEKELEEEVKEQKKEIAELQKKNAELLKAIADNERQIADLKKKIEKAINAAFEAVDKKTEVHRKEKKEIRDTVKVLETKLTMAEKKRKDYSGKEFRSGKSATFSDESENARSGYYIVVGAYQSKENAEKYKNTVKSDYPAARILYNKETGFHYVYLGWFNDIDRCLPVLDKARGSGYPKAWIYLLN